jgi:uncharacterized protein (UPF0548 family)
MEILGVRIGTVHDADLAAHRQAAPTYDHVGSTLAPATSGARHTGTIVVGTGTAAFDAGRSALRSWAPQRGLGATVLPDDARPDLDQTVVLSMGVAGRGVHIPVRVVAVVDEPGRYGWAYGTLPGHPETGEQLFLLEHRPDGEVVLTIHIDAEPARPLRGLRPVARVAQRLALARYLRATRAQVRRTTGRR